MLRLLDSLSQLENRGGAQRAWIREFKQAPQFLEVILYRDTTECQTMIRLQQPHGLGLH